MQCGGASSSSRGLIIILYSAATAAAAATTQSEQENSSSSQQLQQEKKEWEAKKKHRQAEQKKKRRSGENDSDDDDENDSKRQRRRVPIAPDEGHYATSNDNNHTWLEGVVFGDILETDMPVQLWLGSDRATEKERRLPANERHWQDGVVAAVRRRPSAAAHAGRRVVDVAYLRATAATTSDDDEKQDEEEEEEQLKKSVPLADIRILLGSAVDERIPDTLEEARLLAMGGEEIIVHKPVKQEVKAATADTQCYYGRTQRGGGGGNRSVGLVDGPGSPHDGPQRTQGGTRGRPPPAPGRVHPPGATGPRGRGAAHGGGQSVQRGRFGAGGVRRVEYEWWRVQGCEDPQG